MAEKIGPISVDFDSERLKEELSAALIKARLSNKPVDVNYEMRIGRHSVRGVLRAYPDETIGEVPWLE